MHMFAKAVTCAQITKRKIIKPNTAITYPYISGLNNQRAECTINTTITEGVHKLIRMHGYSTIPIADMVGTYEIKLNSHCVLSLVLINYAIHNLEAHGMTYQLAYTFNLRNGHVYTLAELFKPRSPYVNRINDMIKQQIQDREIQLIHEFKSIDANQSFYLTDKDLVIFFPIYQYTPYYYSILTFSIPYTAISDLLAHNSPIRKIRN